jgi:hypothetical protein
MRCPSSEPRQGSSTRQGSRQGSAGKKINDFNVPSGLSPLTGQFSTNRCGNSRDTTSYRSSHISQYTLTTLTTLTDIDADRKFTRQGFSQIVSNPDTPDGPSSDEDETDPDERDALMNEATYAVRQSIPQAQMVAGLIRAARWMR